MSDTPTLMGPKVMLEGPAGTGKTFALGTLVDWCAAQQPPIPVRMLFTENGLETLLGYWRDRGQEPPPNLAWHVAMTKPIGLAGLAEAAKNVGLLSYESITKMVDAKRSENNAFHKILTACSNFPDDRTGEKLGSVDSWPARCVFGIDSLTELCNAAMKMVIGNKPTASPPDYGVAQNNALNFLRLCTQGMPCVFVLTAHVTRETDEITGGVKLMTKGIGKAMANEIPQLFSDVIYTVREGTQFYWDTAAPSVDVKTRYLPIASKQKADFALILDKWLKRSGQ